MQVIYELSEAFGPRAISPYFDEFSFSSFG